MTHCLPLADESPLLECDPGVSQPETSKHLAMFEKIWEAAVTKGAIIQLNHENIQML